MNQPSAQISVTEIRNALRCPRVFVLGRTFTRSVAFPIGSSCLGASFHRVVERLATTVGSPNADLARLPPGSSPDIISRALASWLLDLSSTSLTAMQHFRACQAKSMTWRKPCANSRATWAMLLRPSNQAPVGTGCTGACGRTRSISVLLGRCRSRSQRAHRCPVHDLR